VDKITEYDHSKKKLADALHIEKEDVKMLNDKIQSVLNVVSKKGTKRSEKIEEVEKILSDIDNPLHYAFMVANIAYFFDTLIHKMTDSFMDGVMVEVEKVIKTEEKREEESNNLMFQ